MIVLDVILLIVVLLGGRLRLSRVLLFGGHFGCFSRGQSSAFFYLVLNLAAGGCRGRAASNYASLYSTFHPLKGSNGRLEFARVYCIGA
jgi:hypothetical protein